MNPEVLHNASAHRYEIRVGDELAGFTVAEPTDEPGVILFPHTEIAPAFEGQGLASKLVQGALDDVRERGLRIIATCPYIVGWLPKHPDYEDLVAREDG
jgi:predicted GNAT family acetyltransferase